MSTGRKQPTPCPTASHLKGLELLGMKVKEVITGMVGVVTSISFDLYGCVQALLNPGLDKDGKPRELHWYDVNRLVVISKEPVMEVPKFLSVPGPERDKPIPRDGAR